MKNDKLMLSLLGVVMLTACASNPLSGSELDGFSVIKMASHSKCMDEIESNPTWMLSSKLLSEDQKHKKKRQVCNCVGETLMIGDQVSVTVLGVKGNQVRIGVNAPKEVSVHREEIYQRIQHERAMHEHLQHIDQDYQPSFEDDNTVQNNYNR